MGIKSDRWIKKMAKDHKMIDLLLTNKLLRVQFHMEYHLMVMILELLMSLKFLLMFLIL